MPNIFHQTIEDILKAATPEQKILWNHIFLTFGERCAISQIYFQGAMAGHEMLNYVARRIYLAYQIEFSGDTLTPSAIYRFSGFFNENNVTSHYYENQSAYWDAIAGAVRFMSNIFEMQNLYFSRFAVGYYNRFKFIGYRITY